MIRKYTLAPHQIKAQKALDRVFPDNCVLHLVMRSGKTLTVLDYIKKYPNLKVLWLAESTKERETRLNGDLDKFGFDLDDRLDILLPQSLHKVDVNDYELIVFNECHKITERIRDFLQNAQGRIIGLTGTYPDKQDKIELLKSINLMPVSKYTLEDGIKDGVISDYTITVFEVPLDQERTMPVQTKSGSFFMTSEQASINYYLNKIAEIESTAFPLENEREYLQKKINSYRDYHSESPENKSILRKLFSNNKKIVLRLKPLWLEKGQLYMRLSTALNKMPSKLKRAKEYLNKKLSEDPNSKYLVIAQDTSIAEEFSDYTFHSKTDDKYLKLFQEDKLRHLVLVNKGTTGFNYPETTGIIVTAVNSSKSDIGQKIARTLMLTKGVKKSDIVFFISEDTKQKEWLEKALVDFNPKKIKYKRYE